MPGGFGSAVFLARLHDVMIETPSKLRRFQSGGQAIRVETFPEELENARGSILLLHGANGIRFANPVISGAMQFLGVRDFSVHLVHYFDRTNTTYADDGTIRKCFHLWLETARDALAFVQKENPGAPIALFGHSLGGFLSAAMLISEPAVKAAVILSGGLDEESARNVKRAAPTLILHGSSDTRVPITEARRLESVLTAAGAPPEVHVYRGERHTLEMSSYVDALSRATEFLGRHLG